MQERRNSSLFCINPSTRILIFHLISFMIGRTQIVNVHSGSNTCMFITYSHRPYHTSWHTGFATRKGIWTYGFGLTSMGYSRIFFVYAPSQWETTLQYNVVSHWLGAFTKWSLHIMGSVRERFIKIISYIKQGYKKTIPLWHKRTRYMGVVFSWQQRTRLWIKAIYGKGDHVQHARISSELLPAHVIAFGWSASDENMHMANNYLKPRRDPNFDDYLCRLNMLQLYIFYPRSPEALVLEW